MGRRFHALAAAHMGRVFNFVQRVDNVAQERWQLRAIFHFCARPLPEKRPLVRGRRDRPGVRWAYRHSSIEPTQNRPTVAPLPPLFLPSILPVALPIPPGARSGQGADW